MAEQILSVLRLQDKSLIDCIEKMVEVVKDDSHSATIFVLGGVNIQIDLLNIGSNPQILTILEKDTTLIAWLQLFRQWNITIHFDRGGNKPEKSAFFDVIRINYQDNQTQIE